MESDCVAISRTFGEWGGGCDGLVIEDPELVKHVKEIAFSYVDAQIEKVRAELRDLGADA